LFSPRSFFPPPITSMRDVFDTFEQAVSSAYRLQTVNYVNIISITILVYDTSLALSSEIEFIWKSKWSIVKLLYLFSRYPTFADVSLSVYGVLGSVRVEDCWTINAAATWMVTIGIAVAEAILVFRTTALWGNSKKILWGLSSLLAVRTTLDIHSDSSFSVIQQAIVVMCMVFAYIYLHSSTAIPPPFPSVSACNVGGGNPIIIFNFIFLIIFEIVVLSLTTFRWFKQFKGSNNPLIATLYRDGILFFVCLALISLANVLVLSLGPVEYQGLITPLQRVMHSVLSCRILLNVREVNEKSKRNRLAEMQVSTMSETQVA
jgi:hypothetical protein